MTPEECWGPPFLYQLRPGNTTQHWLSGILCFVRVKVHWGNFNHSGQESKLFLWIAESLIWVKACNFWLYLAAQHSEVIHLTMSGTVPQTVEQSWHQCCFMSTCAGQMFEFYSLQQRHEACWLQATIHQRLRPDLGFVFSRHSRCLWQFSVGSWIKKLFPKGSLDQAEIPALDCILKKTFIACWSKRDFFFLWKNSAEAVNLSHMYLHC